MSEEELASRMMGVGSLRVGVIGLAPVPQNTSHKVSLETLAQQRVTELRANCPLVIALNQLGKAADERLLEQVKGIDLLIGNADWATLKTPLKVNNTYILPTSFKGQHVGRADVTVDIACHSEYYRRTQLPPLASLVGETTDKALPPANSPTPQKRPGRASSVLLPEGVECSSCHGDGLEHSLHPHQKGLITKAPDATLCRQCHTPTQTPHFHYQKFVAKH